jgi:type II secretory pathway pseudopilin PulG
VKKALLVLLGIVIGFAASQGVQSLMNAVEAGKEKRFGADVRVAMRQLEDYRREHTSYPVACDAKSLSDQLGPGNAVIENGESWFQYCSDGQRYLLAFVPFGTRAYRTAYGAPLLVTNNELVSAPAAVLPGGPEAEGKQ